MANVVRASARPFIFKWSRVSLTGGNEKLRTTLGAIGSKGIIGFGLPARRSGLGFLVCPFAGECAAWCFARQGRYTMPNVREPREHNLDTLLRLASLPPRMTLGRAGGNPMPVVGAIAEDLSRKKADLIRIHDSGDFFSSWYLEAWVRVAKLFPERRFYSYTKSHRWIDWENLPENLSLVQSYGGAEDDSIDWTRPVARVFPTSEARRIAGYLDGDAMGDVPAIMEKKRIGLVYHGTKNLTAQQSADMVGG